MRITAKADYAVRASLELAAADVWATGISPNSYPTQFLRADLEAMDVVPADKLLDALDVEGRELSGFGDWAGGTVTRIDPLFPRVDD